MFEADTGDARGVIVATPWDQRSPIPTNLPNADGTIEHEDHLTRMAPTFFPRVWVERRLRCGTCIGVAALLTPTNASGKFNHAWNLPTTGDRPGLFL